MFVDGISAENFPIRSFLMIGQSNMAGRGEIGDVEPIVNPDCFLLRMGRWQKMSEPINPDRAIFNGEFRCGIGLAASFADQLSRECKMQVGLIPCADGGTSIDQWMPGELLFDHAVMQTRLAMRTSQFSGILWHQGESDCNDDESLLAHKAKFVTMITALRRELNAEEVPLIIGELSHCYDPARGLEDRPMRMNEAYRTLEKELPFCKVASAKGLNMKADGLHFNASSCRVFGERYFEKWLELDQK